jgi:hypothetical protein
MSDLEPVSGDLPDLHAEDHDDGIGAPRRGRRWVRVVGVLAAVVVIGAVIAAVAGTGVVATVVAILVGLVILRTGWFFLQSFATPPPAPPEPGELRKVKLVYRCPSCGAEVRMTVAATEDPEPPRHCMEDMELVAPIE